MDRLHQRNLPPPKPKTCTPGVVLQPDVYAGLLRGARQIVNAVRPTLGPLPRVVAVDELYDRQRFGKGPELLDDGGLIARRITQLADRDADMGAMFTRQMLWRLRERAGDGTATAAVIFQSILEAGVRHITFGGSPARLKDFLQAGLALTNAEIERQKVMIEGQDDLTRMAAALCHDDELARCLGEIFDIIGEHGRLEIRPANGRGLEREYVEGMYWDAAVHSPLMLNDAVRGRSDYENAAFLITDLEIEEPEQLFPALQLALDAKIPALIIVAEKLSQKTIAFLLANKKPELFQAAAVRTPGVGQEEQAWALADLALLTGGRAFIHACGDTLTGIRQEDLGRARRAWVERGSFGVIAGKGDAHALRRRLAELRSAFNYIEEPVRRKKVQARIGKLLGGSATLWVGGVTEREIKMRVALAERTAGALRGALLEGVVPGGGAALLTCCELLLARSRQTSDPDERAAYRILARALEEPVRTIAANSGCNPDEVMALLRAAPTGDGFDACRGQVVNMVRAGILDSLAVTCAALWAAISSASLALNVDVLVHRRRPEEANQP